MAIDCFFFLAEKLVNVADKSFNPTCTVSSFYTLSSKASFNCENALTPEWIDYQSWMSASNSDSNNHIKITFKQELMVHSFCLSAIIKSLANRATSVTVKDSNLNIEIYPLDVNTLTECFLPSKSVELSVKYLSFYPTNGHASFRTGLSSVMIFSYDSE